MIKFSFSFSFSLTLFLLSFILGQQDLLAQERGPLVPKMHAMAYALMGIQESPEENLKILKETAAYCLQNSDALAVHGPGGLASKNLQAFHDSFALLVVKIGELEDSMKAEEADRIQKAIEDIWQLAGDAKTAFVPSEGEQ